MADTDLAGIIYFAAPYRWHEELFTGWLKSLGSSVASMMRADVGCPSVGSCAAYSAPLEMDDETVLTLHPSSAGRTSFGLTTLTHRQSDGALAVTTTSWHVWVGWESGADGRRGVRPNPLPEWLRAALDSVVLVAPASQRLPS